MDANSFSHHTKDQRGNNRFRKLAWMVPYLLAILIMLPRIASANFGLLDDAVTLRTVRGIHESGWGVWDLQVGRTRPIYWLLWMVVETIADARPEIFYVVNVLLLLATLWLIERLIAKLGGASYHFLIASLVVLFSVPTIENFYTLSKSEPLQVILILLGIHNTINFQNGSRTLQRMITFAMSITFTLLAILAKETTVILLPIAVCWLMAAHLLNYDKPSRQFIRNYALTVLAAVGIFFIVRFTLVGLNTSEGYASGYEFSFSRLLSSTSRWSAWLLYSFPYLIPFLITPIFLQDDAGRRKYLLLPLIWFVLSILSFLPWIFVASYYLYPALIGIAFFIPAVLLILIEGRQQRLNHAARILAFLGGILFILVQGNTYTAARQQIMVDRVNWEMVSWLGEHLPVASQVFVRLPFGNEYLLEIEIHLQDQFGRRDLVFAPALEILHDGNSTQSEEVFLLVPVIHNQILLSPRLGIDEADVVQLQDDLELEDFQQSTVTSVQDSFTPVTINIASIFCPAVELAANSESISSVLPVESITRYCRETPLVDITRFSYGWSLSKLQPEASAVQRFDPGKQP